MNAQDEALAAFKAVNLLNLIRDLCNWPDYCVLKFTAIQSRHYCDLETESFGIEDLATLCGDD